MSYGAQFSIFRAHLKPWLTYPNWAQGSTHGRAGSPYRMALIAMALPLLVIFCMSLLLATVERAAWGLLFYMRRKWLGMPWLG